MCAAIVYCCSMVALTPYFIEWQDTVNMRSPYDVVGAHVVLVRAAQKHTPYDGLLLRVSEGKNLMYSVGVSVA